MFILRLTGEVPSDLKEGSGRMSWKFNYGKKTIEASVSTMFEVPIEWDGNWNEIAKEYIIPEPEKDHACIKESKESKSAFSKLLEWMHG